MKTIYATPNNETKTVSIVIVDYSQRTLTKKVVSPFDLTVALLDKSNKLKVVSRYFRRHVIKGHINNNFTMKEEKQC